MILRRLLPYFLIVAALSVGQVPVLAAEESGSSAKIQLDPTPTCPQEAVDEIQAAIDFVRGRTWAETPGDDPINLAPDLAQCEVVLHIGKLTSAEEAALLAGAGSRLSIEYRKNWARPSKVLLYLWIIFGGSGLIWLFRRYARG